MQKALAEVLWTARYDYQPQWKLERHRHKHFQMISFRSGEGEFFCDGSVCQLGPGMVFLIKPGQLHGLSAFSTVKTLDIKFVVHDPELKRKLLAAADSIREEDTTSPRCLKKSAGKANKRVRYSGKCAGRTVLHLLVLYIRSDHGKLEAECSEGVGAEETAGGNSLGWKVAEFIRLHYAEDLDEQLISRSLGVSDRHLRQRFKEAMGTMPIRYLVRFRIEKAKEIIQYSDEALKTVADLVGFKSIHYFTRVFQEVTGETPGAWRRRYHEGICKDVCINPYFSNVILTVPGDDQLATSVRSEVPQTSKG